MPQDLAPDAAAAPRMPEIAGILCGLAAALMWASYLAFARAGVKEGLEPQDFLVLRFVTAGVIMLPWLLRHEVSTLAAVGWARGLALTALAGPLFILCGVGGYAFAPLAHGAVIQPAAITLASMGLAAALLGERLNLRHLGGSALIIAGLMLVARSSAVAAREGAWIGDLLFALAGIMWATFTVLLKRWAIGGVTATAIVSVLSALAVAPVFITLDSFGRLADLSLGALALQVLVQGVCAGVLAVIAFGEAVRRLGAAKAGFFPAIVPAVALIVGIPVTGEAPTPLEWVGGAVATLGLAVALGAIGALRRPATSRADPTTKEDLS